MRLIQEVFQTMRSLSSQAFAAVILAATLSPAGAQPQAETAPVAPRTRAEIAYSFAPVVKKAQPAVVNVFASRVERMPANPFLDDPIFRRFLDRKSTRLNSSHIPLSRMPSSA